MLVGAGGGPALQSLERDPQLAGGHDEEGAEDGVGFGRDLPVGLALLGRPHAGSSQKQEFGLVVAIEGNGDHSKDFAAAHSFSVRDQVPPKGAHDFRQSIAIAPQGACVEQRFGGLSGSPDLQIFPGLPGHRAALMGRSSCFWGSVLPLARESRRAQETPFGDSRQRG